MSAVHTLQSAWADRRTMLSVGLEPCPEYLPASGEYEPTISGYESFMMSVVEGACSDVVPAAFKFNTAFFEALGPEGWSLLKRVRDRLPAGAVVIADSKRGDIGSTAKRYALAAFDWLGADAVTLNPLMGRDSAEPFLEYPGKLCIFLCLTSNPGSSDFLLRDGLYLRIARDVSAWAPTVGLVVGATHPARVAEVRAAAAGAVLLIPGLGAQGGEVGPVVAAALQGAAPPFAGSPGALFHVTRGVLPEAGDRGPLAEVVRRKCAELRASIADIVLRRPALKESAHA